MEYRFFVGSSRSRQFAATAASILAAVLLGLGQPSAAIAAIPIPSTCQPDFDGANDVPGKTDVTKYCADADGGMPFDLETITNLDETTINGANTADVCSLYDTDADGFVNLAVCMTLDGSGPGNLFMLQDLRLFTCNDTKVDRCGAPSLVAGPYTSTCEVSQQNTDPFPGPAPGPGDLYPVDTQILCGLSLADFGPAGVGARPTDTCSYSSNNPNSNPHDCVNYQTCLTNADCDDASPCTTDTCDGSGVCAYTPNEGEPCSDGLFCNGVEVCTAFGLCGAAPAPHDCNDNVDCTIDSCDEFTDSCVNDPRNSLCSDDVFCNGVETCDAIDGCQAGTPTDCSDGIACTSDSCDEGTASCLHSPNDGFCDNGDFCDGSETCDVDNGCLPGTEPDCTDTVGCTIDSCNESTDSCDHATNDASCDNGDFCDGSETCDALNDCQPGTAPDCDDGIACTTDSCDEGGDFCAHAPDNSACGNGDFCDGTEQCIPGLGCAAGVVPDCDDGIACTTDSCNETTDSCDHAPDNGACGNADFCDGVEECIPGLGCAAGTVPDCDDGVDCTTDTCNETTDSCDHAPNDAFCSDGDYCDGVETCDTEDGCLAGTAPDCTDTVGCTVDTCNESTDSCDHTPDNGDCSDGKFCNGDETCDVLNDCQPGVAPGCGDGIGCTIDSCDTGLDECVHTPDDSVCGNSDYCDGVEQCIPGIGCAAGVAPDCNDDVDCTTDECNETTDSCDHTPSDAYCSDGEFCDGVETCDKEFDCQPGTAPDCTDTVGCTTDTCNETTDECDHTPDNGDCADTTFCNGVEICDPQLDCQPGADPCPGLQCDEMADQCTGCLTNQDCDNSVFCDGAEVCVSGTCTPGTPPSCDDDVDCTVDDCDEQAAECTHTPSNAICDNGDYCDGLETCDAELDCQAGPVPDCNDGVPCSVDTCNEATDSCDHTANNAACDDGDFCNGVETCDPTDGCENGTAPDCSDGVGCTTDTCNETTDSCDHAPNNASCSNGQFCDGAEVCNPVTGCEAAPDPVDCGDGIACTTDTCNETTDSCDHAPNDGACSNGLFCDGAETCDTEEGCLSGPPPSCADAVSCTTDTCNEMTDSCDHTPVNASCSNGQFCDGAETCDPTLGCQAGQAPDCSDGVVCTNDTCNEMTDTCDHTPQDGVCSNEVYCDGFETCDPMAGCQPSAGPIDCDDGVACTTDTCNEMTASCDHTPHDALCSNGQFCDGAETCDSMLGCQAGSPPDCTDGVMCTTDTCNEMTDSCDHVASDMACNDGLFCDGVETCNAMTGCQAGSPVACGDAFMCTTDACDEMTDACTHDFSPCKCGDSEVTGIEECDPPKMAGTFEDCNNSIDDDGDGKIDCRDKDCKPNVVRNPPFCGEDCMTDLVCAKFLRDPAIISYNMDGGPDEFYLHGRMPMFGDLDSAVRGVTVELANDDGAVYRAFLFGGDMRGRLGRRHYIFTDDSAEFLGQDSVRGGLARLGLRSRKFHGVRFLVFTIRAYGNFAAANKFTMTSSLTAGSESGFLTADWNATPRGWVLHQSEFD